MCFFEEFYIYVCLKGGCSLMLGVSQLDRDGLEGRSKRRSRVSACYTVRAADKRFSRKHLAMPEANVALAE